MNDETTGALFGGPGAADPPAFEQDGPDLFGLEPDELIVTHEPDHLAVLDIDLDEDEMAEIPIDPDDPPEVQATAADVQEPAQEPAFDEAEQDEGEQDEGEPTVVVPLLAAPGRPAAPERREAPLALYRRYRPESFAGVIGQDHVTEPLRRALVNNRVNHAYLFSGPRGCGKTTSARILARCLNCEQGPTPEPCGVCQSCRDLARGGTGSIDVIEIDAASHGGVNEARDLRERAFFAPVHSRYKIYIIDEAHMVTKEGFNALLKLVEEPPSHVKFIFATTEPEKVLGTIRSRTHHYPFRLVPPRVLTGYLESLCAAEGVSVDRAVLPLVVRAGAGSVRDSLSVLDQLLGGAGPDGVSYGQAAALLGYTPDTLLDEILDAFAAGDSAGVFASIDKVIEVGQDPRRFAEDLLRRLRDLIIVAAVPEALTSGLVDVAADQAERLTVQAQGMGAGELTRAAEVIAKGLTDMRGTTAPRLHLELMCARVLLPGADVDARGIHARLDRLERRLSMVGEPGRPTDAPTPAPPADAPRPAGSPAPDAAGWVADWDPSAPPQGRAGHGRGEQFRPPAAGPDAPRPAATPPAPPAAGPTDPGQLTTADVRRMWPRILESVKGRRKLTWIMLSQNAQVHSLDAGALTLALANPGVAESFGRTGSADILRESLIEVLGIAPRIETTLAGGPPLPGTPRQAPPPPAAAQPAPSQPASTQPAQQSQAPERPAQAAQAPQPSARQRPAPSDRPARSATERPAAAPAPEPAPRSRGRGAAPAASGPGGRAGRAAGGQPPRRAPAAHSPEPPPDDEEEYERPDFAALARENIRPTQVGPRAARPEVEQRRDDPDLDTENLGVDDLLRKELGAQLIAEEPERP